MVKRKYLQSLCIKGVIGASGIGIILPFAVDYVFSEARAEIEYRCRGKTDEVALVKCDHRLGRTDRFETFIKAICGAIGLGSSAIAVEGRRRAKGPLGTIVDENEDGIDDRLQKLEQSVGISKPSKPVTLVKIAGADPQVEDVQPEDTEFLV